jgi:hypothetical protein
MLLAVARRPSAPLRDVTRRKKVEFLRFGLRSSSMGGAISPHPSPPLRLDIHMNPHLQPTPRRQDLALQIGQRHGYRIDGEHVLVNAELLIPPHRSGGAWTLELWATDRPHQEEQPLTGHRIAQVALELPTPIGPGPHVHQVDTRAVARLPRHGRAYAMVLALMEHRPGGQTSVHAFANYPETQAFSAPHFAGKVGYTLQGAEVVLEAEGIFNPRTSANLSGTLSLELWAFPEAEVPTGEDGVRLASVELGRIGGQSQVGAIERRVAFAEPLEGRFGLALVLCEWTVAHGNVARDRRDFRCIYERGVSERADSTSAAGPVTVAPAGAPAPAPAPTALAALPRPIDRLRLVPTKQPVPPAATSGESSQPKPGLPGPVLPRRVSIQTGSVDELAGVKGLGLKIAKEIVKARPFSSVADLIRVRGLGEKTIARLADLVTL